ncbi:type II toxin-antitoxin system RelE/ParE family toxin [Hyalangium versicolor]|uniref:type II toxin-antitoxin system RelE/ParE family toxin n=1 Tax=Hyalangium versicolor TaxID=2861190 RepID=UPI001CCE98CF
MKRLRLLFSRDAAREVAEALAWWSANRTAAPMALREDLRRGLELIRTQPEAGARAANARLPGVRRLNLGRVRYHLYYCISEDGSAVEVLSLWHSSRGAGPSL